MRPYQTELKSPAEVLDLARAQGKLDQIEQLTWSLSMKKFNDVHNELDGKYKLFINSLPAHLMPIHFFQELAEQYPDLIKRIVMEITEEDRLNPEEINRSLKAVRALGIQLAIDDYGAGYNAQKLLIDIEPEYVKIDTNLIRGIDSDVNRQETVKNVLNYTKPRGIKLIAEGVETKEEFYFLREAGVELIQGYIIQRPEKMPQPLSKEAIRLIKSKNPASIKKPY